MEPLLAFYISLSMSTLSRIFLYLYVFLSLFTLYRCYIKAHTHTFVLDMKILIITFNLPTFMAVCKVCDIIITLCGDIKKFTAWSQKTKNQFPQKSTA